MTETLVTRLRDRAAKARRTVAECADATSAPRPNHEDEDGHESYVPCALCVSAVLNAQLMEDAATALTAAHAERDAAQRAKRVTFCHFCLVKIDLNGMTPPQALDALKEHSLTCAESPIVAQLTAALRERDALAAQLAQRGEAR